MSIGRDRIASTHPGVAHRFQDFIERNLKIAAAHDPHRVNNDHVPAEQVSDSLAAVRALIDRIETHIGVPSYVVSRRLVK